ncbi:hypothetical protein M5C72_07805 [Companilactobacillus allii]|uniref:Uncharacterized protein n=2 Tax=Companilactobacillus allii TaxID=1847728 RepID=A0A1P8Q568_9LACO|nr:hypothetical protein [Companilactobacillus allii]APX72993.1 hypothetical protein BTM29_10715 [Companilactobacillus allii]USQ67789.1 hypothetical protein M5C72_07805 [Companilactobacillus allii]
MNSTITFGREINHGPLFRSILISAILGIASSFANNKIGITIFLIILFVMLFIYYPSYLPLLYGYWILEKHGITYYDMSSYRAKLKLIFLAKQSKLQFISYSQIHNFTVKTENKTYSVEDITTLNNTKQSHFVWLRKPLNLEIQLKSHNINLDMSFDQLHDNKNIQARVMNVSNILEEKI